MYGETSQHQLDAQIAQNAYITKVFGIMFAGLLITSFAAFFAVNNEFMTNLFRSSPVIVYALLIAEVILVISLSARINKMSYGTALSMFFVYAILNGITLSTIFFVYEIGTIGLAFTVAAVTFGVMAVYGLVTRNDLTRIGSVLFMLLIGGLVSMLLNVFFDSDTFDLLISFVLVIAFVGLVAYDTQKLKGYFYATQDNIEAQRKTGVMGALSLYLDFVNIFLYLLRIFGNRR